MEGNQLMFFVTYQSREALISLSEYDTVEQLKIEIDNCFNIAVTKQDIIGWHTIPTSDDTILKVCSSHDINCLDVNEIISINTVQNSDSDPVDDMDFSNIKDHIDGELAAITRLKEKLPFNVPIKLQQMCLQDAVSHINSTNQKKALLLYLYNSQDDFAHQFLSLVHDDEIKRLLDQSFLIIGWDIEDQNYHHALTRTLNNYEPLKFISNLITEKTSAAICLLADNQELSLFFCLRGNVNYDNVMELLNHIQNECDMSGTVYGEIEAIKSLKRKLPSDISVTFRHFSLDDAINFICTAPFDERKALILYLHNSELPFSQMFSQNLKNSELAQILNRNFLVLGWDVENPEYHEALQNALSRHMNLAVVSGLVANRVAVGLCILPVNGTISVCLCLRGKITLKDTIKSLKEAENAFKQEIEREKELKKIESEKGNKNDLTAEKLQTIWANMLGDRDYDSFEYDQHQFLKDKIGFALRGPPQEETGYNEKTLKLIDELYEVIKTQSDEIAQFKDHIEISFIYNCLEPLPQEKIKREKEYPDYNPLTDVNPVPIFILRKCRGGNNPCRVFIDDTGRVYKNWNEYLTRNKLPEWEMVVPLNGRYQVIDEKVQLERHLSPACHLDTKFLQVGDIVSTVAGLASGAVFVTASLGIAALPVAPAVLIAASVAGVSAGVWAIARSAYTLYDRSRHEESMSFANSEARGAYLNIVAGSLGFVGAGANMAITQLATRGVNIGQGATYFVNTLGALNIGAGGASLANSGYEVFDQWYNENQTPSALTILQLSSSVLFFGHAVYSFRGAQTIIDETQAKVLKDYQDSLRSNRHRKTFNKLMKETMRTQGDGVRGKAEVISAIRNIPNKDEVFAALTRNNKAMNKAGIKFSADGGQITLGGMAVDMNEFIGMNKKQTETFLSNLPHQETFNVPNAPSTNSSSLKTAITGMLTDINIDSSGINLAQLITLTTELLAFCSGDIKTKVINAVHQAIHYVLLKLSSQITDEIDEIIPKNTQFYEFLRLGISFFSQKVDDLERRYQKYQSTGNPTYYDPIFDHVNPVYVKRTVAFFEFVVRNSYSGQTLTKAVLTEISGYVTAWITRIIFENDEKKEREKQRDRHSAGFRAKLVACGVCGGYYFSHAP